MLSYSLHTKSSFFAKQPVLQYFHSGAVDHQLHHFPHCCAGAADDVHSQVFDQASAKKRFCVPAEKRFLHCSPGKGAGSEAVDTASETFALLGKSSDF